MRKLHLLLGVTLVVGAAFGVAPASAAGNATVCDGTLAPGSVTGVETGQCAGL